MKLTKIGYAGGPNPTIHTTLQDLEPGICSLLFNCL